MWSEGLDHVVEEELGVEAPHLQPQFAFDIGAERSGSASRVSLGSSILAMAGER
jgi:hypothetical protein